ncbi:MT-A70-domain-containing protein [Dendrothele bispora CBS 962.96]|uniref:MT-A70-domain-containing protein n=1 Tax=Dendrothele bispora (strain CBS 962.96) TaxID=1314807 RepID=A0A4S8LW84_DENBC|nr:MT-A70-domain-containing protein [Dendrothele bispora CBS 962.96]
MPTATTTQILSSANDLLAAHATLISRVRQAQKEHRQQLQFAQPSPDLPKLPLISSSPPSPTDSQSPPPASPAGPRAQRIRQDLPPAKRARCLRYKNYVPEEETIRNDYSQHYVDSGDWPQNWVLGADPERRFEEYPKQQRLLNLKKASVTNHALPPYYLPFSALSSMMPSKFDVILLDPPFSSAFTWDHLQELPIPSLAADPSFVFIWVGSGAGDGLERGREVLAKWGYRRCEDVVWVKTNKTSNKGPGMDPPTTSLFTRTKQHCLIGIRGTVRRSTDSWFVHCNVDTDVILWEGDPDDPMRKPPEMYTLIENFCLGLRRLEIFGRASSSLRRGWVTVLGQVEEDKLQTMRESGSADTDSIFIEGDEGGNATRWDKARWDNEIKQLASAGGGKPVVPMTADIDALRPKSPFRPGAQGSAPSGSTNGTGGVARGIADGGEFRYYFAVLIDTLFFVFSFANRSIPVTSPAVGPRQNGAPSRPGFNGQSTSMSIQRNAANQMMAMGMNGMNSMNSMNPTMGMNVGNAMGMEGMPGMSVMGGWPGMMPGVMGTTGNGMSNGMGHINLGNMNGINHNIGNMGQGMGVGMVGSMPMTGGGYQGQQPGGNFVPMPMFDGSMNGSMSWGDQGQFGMNGAGGAVWDSEGMMSGMPSAMNMNGSMMGQWGQ